MTFQVNPRWLDQYGNIKPNSWDEQSENPSTFNAAYFFLMRNYYYMVDYENTPHTMSLLIKSKYLTNKGEFRTMEYDNNPKFSLDEKISCAAIAHYLGMKEALEHLEIFTLDPSHYRPDVFFFVLACKFPMLTPLCWIFTALPAMYTCLFGNDSSGPQLVFIKCQGLRLEKLFKICTELIAMSNYYRGGSWNDIFAEYYPEEDHPSRILANKIWGI